MYLSFKLATNSRREEVSELLETLEKGGMKGYDISDDELAKSHSRYMIGGAHRVENERLFRFGMCPCFNRPSVRVGQVPLPKLTHCEHRVS